MRWSLLTALQRLQGRGSGKWALADMVKVPARHFSPPHLDLTPWPDMPYRARCRLERVAIWLRRRLAERLGSATYAAEANIASKLILPRTIRILATHHKPWRKLLGGISALQNICGFGFAQLFARLPSCQKRFIATKREDVTWTLL
jgi:hypothetical protein